MVIMDIVSWEALVRNIMKKAIIEILNNCYYFYYFI